MPLLPMFSPRRRLDEGVAPTSERAKARPRRRRREVLCPDLDRVPAGALPWASEPASAPRAALHAAVRAAVASALTDRQRRMVEGYFFEGLSQGELARELDVSQQVVQKALFGAVRGGKRVGGALSRLRAALAREVAGDGRSGGGAPEGRGR